MAIKQSHVIIAASLAAVGIILSFTLVWADLQSQVETLTEEKEAQQGELEEQQRELEREETIRLQQQKKLEEQQRELEREETIRLQQQTKLEEQQRELEREETIRLQQQKKLEEQQRDLELQKRAQIEEMAKTNPLVMGLIDGELKFYIEPVPSYASSNVKKSVDKVASWIEEFDFISEMKFKRVYNENDAHIHISWIKNYGSHVLGEAIFKSVVKVGLGADNCYGDWRPFFSVTVEKIMLHEFFHSIGFGHSNDPNSIVYPKIDPRFETDYEETIALDEGEYITLQFCSGGTKGYEISSEDQFNGFYVYVLPPETDSTNFIEYGIGKDIPNCSTEDLMVTFGKTCTVPEGAKLVIDHPYDSDFLNSDLIRVDVMIISDPGKTIGVDAQWDSDTFEYDDAWLNEIWNMYH